MRLDRSTFFIVEGRLEQLFIQNACKGRAVIVLDLNGKDVAPQQIADRIALLWRTQKKQYRKAVVLFDREKRELSSQQLINIIAEGLIKSGFKQENFVLGCADRMIENWILADQNWNSEYLEKLDGIECADGDSGKAKIAQAFELVGVKYNHAIGAELLGKCRSSEIRKKSASAEMFFASFEERCWWLER